MIVCPSCGVPNKGLKKCIHCGCYLPPLLEEKDDFRLLFDVAEYLHENQYPRHKSYAYGSQGYAYGRNIYGEIERVDFI